jgi:flagellar FliL protein
MANVEEDLDLDVEKEAPAPKSPLLKIILIAVAGMSLLTGIAVGSLYFLGMIGGDETPATADAGQAVAGDKADAKDAATDKDAKDTKDAKDKKPAKADKGPAIYQTLDPAFVVNFNDVDGTMRFLQISMEVSTRDADVIEAIKTHMPVIRNNLVILFSSQTVQSLSTREGKEKLRADALAEVQQVMKDNIKKPGVEAVYFTNFVMQ